LFFLGGRIFTGVNGNGVTQFAIEVKKLLFQAVLIYNTRSGPGREESERSRTGTCFRKGRYWDFPVQRGPQVGVKLPVLKDGASRQGSFFNRVPLDPALKGGACGAHPGQMESMGRGSSDEKPLFMLQEKSSG